MLGKMLPYAAVFFTRSFVLFALTCILMAAGAITARWTEFHQVIVTHGGLTVFLSAAMISFAIGVVHEFAHGIACKYWGGEVKEIGILLLYFNPGLYCDVSDALLFERKSQRLWTMLAGPISEAALGSLAVLAWCLTPRPSTASAVLAFVILLTGVKLIFNFNPLIRLDGYYLTCDLLNVPNLRSRSFRFARQWITSALKPSSAAPRTSTYEAWVFTVYCVLAIPFSIFFAGAMFLKSCHFLLSHYGRAGWLAVAVIVLILSEPLIAKMARKGPAQTTL